MNAYEELYHHGVKGMKWGVRRYQKPDGSLTREGRIHLRANLEKEYRSRGKGKLGAKLTAVRDANYYSEYSRAEEKANKKKTKIENKMEKTPAESRRAARLGKQWVKARTREIHADRLQKDLIENSAAVDKYLKRAALWSAVVGPELGSVIASYRERDDDNSWTSRVNESFYGAKTQAKEEYKKRR